ncbi:MAG: 4a-hydroxytetrahydrobiopterin dehydratase [Hyphomicrobiaceae bacterium]
MGRERLTETERTAALAALSGWTLVEGREAIARSYKFKEFNAAFGFMTRVALKAEQLDHHPEWTNVWNRVDVTLTTHSAKGLTELDIALARHCDAVAAEISGSPGR